MKNKIKLLAALLIWNASFIHYSNAQSKSGRPTIGLTLSGGGAKGLAHIGILQAIDSAGLKIDYITGTSMGSVMGAMYAAGYSGDSIEKIARTIDWDVLFSTTPQLNDISIEEKSEYDKYLIEIPFEKGKFKIGKGIIEGQELWLKLSEVFQPVYNINDFSKLPIPFKCIGTDLSTGNSIEMDHGSLVNAVRASMAIPSVFTPVKYEDKTLVDGGVVNNFPVLNIKNMGADFVIGVNVSQGLFHADSLKTALDILFQIAFYKDAENFEKHKANCDVYITPDLTGYSTGSFASADSIIEIGKETGKLFYPYFKKLADSLNLIYPGMNYVKDRLPKNKILTISKYTVEGLNNTTEKFFFGLLNLPANKEFSQEKISRSIRRIFGSRYYSIIKYNFIQLGNGETEMHFIVQENSLSNFKFALNYTNFTKIGLKLNLTTRDLLIKESRALASFELSENPRAYLEYYKYLTKGRRTRLNFNIYGESVYYPVFDNFRLFETLRSSFVTAEVAIQYNISISTMIGAGQQRVLSKIKTSESPSLIYNGNNNYWCTNISFLHNNVDEKYFSNKGWLIKAEVGYIYGQDPDFEVSYSDKQLSSDTLNINYEAYPRLYLNMNHYSQLNKKFTFSQNLTLGYIIEDNPYIANNFLAGGVNELIRNQIPFVGLDESEIKTGSISTAQLGIQYNIYSKTYLTGRINAGVYDFHNVKSITTENNLLTGYGLTFGLKTALGPIELTGMYCDQDGKIRSNIRAGFLF